jgi:hypothetical protein
MRFADLPEAPRKPHAFATTTARDVAMRSRPFGDLTVHVREIGEGPPLLFSMGS